MNTIRSFLLSAALLGIISPTVDALTPTGSIGGTLSSERQLNGELVDRNNQRIVTTVGTYELGPGVIVDDRTRYDTDSSDGQGQPQVQLIFDGERLQKVIIY